MKYHIARLWEGPDQTGLLTQICRSNQASRNAIFFKRQFIKNHWTEWEQCDPFLRSITRIVVGLSDTKLLDERKPTTDEKELELPRIEPWSL